MDEFWPLTEKRRARRTSLRCPAQVRSASAELTAACVDLSLSGAGLLLEQPLTNGDQVTLRIVLPTGAQVVVAAQIARGPTEQTPTTGARFINLGSEALRAIHSCLTADVPKSD